MKLVRSVLPSANEYDTVVKQQEQKQRSCLRPLRNCIEGSSQLEIKKGGEYNSVLIVNEHWLSYIDTLKIPIQFLHYGQKEQGTLQTKPPEQNSPD